MTVPKRCLPGVDVLKY